MRKDILNTPKNVTSNAKLTKTIEFSELKGSDDKKKKIEMVLRQRAISINGTSNMQEDEAAFEAWALLIHVHCGYDIQLSVDQQAFEENPKETKDLGHYNRFLYRAMKFNEKYKEWFNLSDSLAISVKEFKKELFNGETEYFNNYPKKEASTGDKLENIVESIFANNDRNLLKELVYSHTNLSIDSEKIFRQLPVGLFKNEVKTNTRFFTGGSSAIDLWTIVDDTIAIFELKSNNTKVGIITELMFYADYMYDMYIDRDNRFIPILAKKATRGYNITT